MGHRHQPAATVRAPVADPAVIRPAHRLRVLGVLALSLPGQIEARVDDGGIEAPLCRGA
jgi:hypothetical protein